MLLSNKKFVIKELLMRGSESMDNILGNKIRELRKKQNLTLKQFVEATNFKISKSYLWELENSDGKSPSAEILSVIADTLQVSVNYFLENDNRKPEEKDLDEAFFRGYKNLQTPDKEQLRKILRTFKDE